MLHAAEIIFTVEPNNQNDPVATTNVPLDTGYIKENAISGTLVRSSASDTPALRILVTDADLVIFLLIHNIITS